MSAPITVKARFHEPAEGALDVDVSGFDFIEIRRGFNTIRLSVTGDRLVVSGDGQLVIHLSGANRFEIPVESQP